MAPILEVESTLTDRYQTTVPDPIRRALKLGKRDKIHYAVEPDGTVVITRADSAEDSDPVLGKFLGFLADDISNHPERIQAIDTELSHRIQSLIGDTEVDLDIPLSDDDE